MSGISEGRDATGHATLREPCDHGSGTLFATPDNCSCSAHPFVRICGCAAMNYELKGADVSMFFSALPPGIDGTDAAASGMDSGSMTMAHRIGQVISRRSPLLIIDGDRAAPNLLVTSCIQQGEVTPLAGILSRERAKMGDTTLLFAACALDTLIAQADRILLLDRHAATAIDRGKFRSMLQESLLRISDGLR